MTDEEKRDLATYRISNAKKALAEVQILAQNSLWNLGVSRTYYACFYAVTALLVYNNISTKTHGGTRQMFGLHFVDKGIIPSETGRFYTKLFGMRRNSDYEDYIEYKEEDLLALIPKAKELIDQIADVLKIHHTS